MRRVTLTFHGISVRGSEDPYWMTTASFERVLDVLAADPRVSYTFDDGYRSDVELALPILAERSLSAIFFVLPGLLGSPGRLTREDLSELVDHGMEVGSHGMRHRPWRRLSDDAAKEEFVLARKEIESATGRKVTDAACPFGIYDRRTLIRLRDLGYRRVFTSDGLASEGCSWLTPRVTITSNTDLSRLQHLLEPSFIRSTEQAWWRIKAALKRRR